jgi:hypothetical protein
MRGETKMGKIRPSWFIIAGVITFGLWKLRSGKAAPSFKGMGGATGGNFSAFPFPNGDNMGGSNGYA